MTAAEKNGWVSTRMAINLKPRFFGFFKYFFCFLLPDRVERPEQVQGFCGREAKYRLALEAKKRTNKYFFLDQWFPLNNAYRRYDHERELVCVVRVDVADGRRGEVEREVCVFPREVVSLLQFRVGLGGAGLGLLIVTVLDVVLPANATNAIDFRKKIHRFLCRQYAVYMYLCSCGGWKSLINQNLEVPFC